MIKKLVSVILPTFNRSHVLKRSIESVLRQSYDNFELIVVDDGSTDTTEEIVNSYKDKRIKYIRYETNKGANAARNIGIENSKGEYIAFQDSDDEWLSEKLEKQLAVLEDPKYKDHIVYCRIERIYKDHKEQIPKEKDINQSGNISKRLLRYNFISTQALLLKREYFKKVGMFDEKLPRLQDWDMVLRLALVYKFKYINEVLVKLYFQTDSISSNTLAKFQSQLMLLKKHRKHYMRHKLIYIIRILELIRTKIQVLLKK